MVAFLPEHLLYLILNNKKMIKIALIIDIKTNAGGGIGMCLTKLNYLKKIKNKNFLIITTYKSTSLLLEKKYKINNIFYNKNSAINKIINLCSKKTNFFSSSFENFLLKKNINKIFFLNPSYLNLLIKKISYIYTIWDLSHTEKNLDKLPEHNKIVKNIRDKCYQLAAKKASYIVIGTKENKYKFIKKYKCKNKKLKILKFKPYICTKKNVKLSKINAYYRKQKNFFLYPAQYWEHKNHKFLVNFFEKYKDNKLIKNFNLVCTGHDKGNFSYLKKIIKLKKLEKKIILLKYLEDDVLYYLYKQSIGLIFPSLIGSHSFPMHEAFYFRKPVFYNKKILSNEFKKFVYLIDIKSIDNLYKKIKTHFSKNNSKVINNAKKKFEMLFNEKKIISDIKLILDKI